jgi:hypothetical protein
MFLTPDTFITESNTTALSAAGAIYLDREKTTRITAMPKFGKGTTKTLTAADV